MFRKTIRKNTFLLLVLTTLLSCKDSSEKKKETDTTSSEVLAEISESSFTDLDGNPIELADFEGKRILLNYWATWCRPCIEEMPSLHSAQEVLRGENYVFLLAADQSMEKIKAFKKKKNFDFTFLRYNGVLGDLQINALPTTFIYNESGKFVSRIDGATEWDSPQIIDRLRAVK